MGTDWGYWLGTDLMYYFIPFLLTVFSGELGYSDINWHRQPPLHLSKKNWEVVHAHLKGTALSNSLLCHSMVFFNPLTYILYPLTGYPLTKFLNPLKIFFWIILFWGSFHNLIRLCRRYLQFDLHAFIVANPLCVGMSLKRYINEALVETQITSLSFRPTLAP